MPPQQEKKPALCIGIEVAHGVGPCKQRAAPWGQGMAAMGPASTPAIRATLISLPLFNTLVNQAAPWQPAPCSRCPSITAAQLGGWAALKPIWHPKPTSSSQCPPLVGQTKPNHGAANTNGHTLAAVVGHTSPATRPKQHNLAHPPW